MLSTQYSYKDGRLVNIEPVLKHSEGLAFLDRFLSSGANVNATVDFNAKFLDSITNYPRLRGPFTQMSAPVFLKR